MNLLETYSSSDHLTCRWVCFFIRFGEMCRSITCSLMDPLQWMGAVRMRVQTEKYAQIKHHLQSKTSLNRYVSGFWSERITADGLLHWRNCCGLWTGFWFIDKTYCWICFLQTHSFDWSGVDYLWCFYQLFGLILTAPIHCRASIAETLIQRHFYKSDEETNSS